MAKKKTQMKQQPLSPEKYIKERARTLPVCGCHVNQDWTEVGLATVVVVRRHPQNTYTCGYYLVDTFCRGVKDSLYKFSISGEELENLLDMTGGPKRLQKIDYAEAHNLIFGAIAFAEEAGIEPDKSFDLTRYLLEEDTDDIPLIDYEYGKEGRHFLAAFSRLEANKYLPLLEKNLKGNYEYTVLDEEDDDDDEFPMTTYSYSHPDYPMVLEMENPKVLSAFSDSENANGMEEEQIAEILALPHDSLCRDIEQLILFETGCTCDEIPEERWEYDTSTLMHALTFLGEVGNEDSLDVALETLRQNEEYYEYHFGDVSDMIYIPTLYLLGRKQLPKLFAFLKEPGLYTFARYHIFPAVAMIAQREPERRDEVIEWFRQVLLFYTEMLPENVYCDGTLTGMMLADLLNIKAQELLPEIKAMFATGLVDYGCCGGYEEVEEEMLSSISEEESPYSSDIYERYAGYRKLLKDLG